MAAQELARQYPEIDVNPDVLYVDNGRILTSAGAAAGLDLCLHMIRRDLGGEIAAYTARLVVMPLERAGGQAQFIVHHPPAPDDNTARPSIGLDREKSRKGPFAPRDRVPCRDEHKNIEQAISGASRRDAGAVGWTRVRRAQQLLETTGLSVEEIVAHSGFGSASVLRDHFTGMVGTSPLVYRRSFGSARQR